MQRTVSIVFLLALALLTGCQADPTKTAPMTLAEIDSKISQIQSDPNMPEQVKQQVLWDLTRSRNNLAKAKH